MGFLETIIYAVICALISFFCGYYIIAVSFRRKKTKTYKFEETELFDIKGSVDVSSLEVNKGSLLDGAQAVDNFHD